MKQKILEKAEEMFLNYGAKSITMDDIAKEMGISKKTIYVHFSNKEKLVEVVVFSVFNTISKAIDEICDKSTNPIKELFDIKFSVMKFLKREGASSQYQLKKYYPKIFKTLRSKQFEKVNTSVKNNLKKGIEIGFFRSEIDLEFISRIYFNGMIGVKEEAIFPSSQFKINYLKDSFLEYHLRAIVTPKGLKELEKQLKE